MCKELILDWDGPNAIPGGKSYNEQQAQQTESLMNCNVV